MKTGAFLATTGLFTDAANWTGQVGLDINNPPSVMFRADDTPTAGTIQVTNAVDKNWGGGLIHNKIKPVPRHDDGTFYQHVAWQLEFMMPGATYHNLARHELDIKCCIKSRPDPNTKIQNVCDWSTQWNRDSGQFQIDNAEGRWTNTGFVVSPEDYTPDIWHLQSYRFWFDPSAGVCSVLSIRYDDRLFLVPASLRRIPLLQTNWEEVVALQIQNEAFTPGSTLIQYRNGILLWSDEAISTDPIVLDLGREHHHHRHHHDEFPE
jgi:hypothetical protein